MAPVNKVVVAVVRSSNVDLELAEKAASCLGSSLPKKPREQVVDDLLERLQKVKVRRELKGLNHWEEFAPAYLQKLLTRHEAKRRARIEAFFRAEHATAIARAEAQLGNRVDAEDVVSETFQALLEGRTTIVYFYHALKGNILNRLEGNKNRSKRTTSLEKIISPATLSLEQVAWGPEGVDTLTLEPLSHHPEDHDPLDVLIAREQMEARRQRVKKARRVAQRDWRYCWIGQKKWGRELGISTVRVGKS